MEKAKAEELISEFCDHYCRWPWVCMNQDRLDVHCDACPLPKLLEQEDEEKENHHDHTDT